MARHRRPYHLVALAGGVLLLSIGACTAPDVDSLGGGGGGSPAEASAELADPSDGAAAVLERLATARSARVEHTLSIVVPDSAGASTWFGLSARLDRSAGRAEGTLDSWSDEGEEGPMTTWPEGTSTMSTARIVGDTVHMRFGDPADAATASVPWRDVTTLGDVAPVVAHLRSVDELVELLADAVDERPPSVIDEGASWRGTVPPSLLVDLWESAGPIGSVVRLTNGMPADVVDDVHAFEIVDEGDGSVRLALWLDVGRLAGNVGEQPPPGALDSLDMRLEVVWDDLDQPVDIPEP